MAHRLGWLIHQSREDRPALFRFAFYEREFLWCLYTGSGVSLIGTTRYRPWLWSFVGGSAPQLVLAVVTFVTKNPAYKPNLAVVCWIPVMWFVLTLIIQVVIFIATVPRPTPEE